MVNLGGQSDDTPSTSLRDIYEVLYQQGYELSAEGDTNAELQAAPNPTTPFTSWHCKWISIGEIHLFSRQSKDFLPLVLMIVP